MEDHPDIHSELGFAGPRRFVNRPAPRPVDLDSLRAYHRGELEDVDAVEIDHLIALFREWHEASGQILVELAAELTKNTAIEGNETESNADLAEMEANFNDEQLDQSSFEESLDSEAAAYFRMELLELRSELSEYAEVYRSDPLAPYRAELRQLICEKWNWKERQSDPALQDREAIAIAIAHLIKDSGVQLPFPPALVAALLVRDGLEHLCQPFQ